MDICRVLRCVRLNSVAVEVALRSKIKLTNLMRNEVKLKCTQEKEGTHIVNVDSAVNHTEVGYKLSGNKLTSAVVEDMATRKISGENSKAAASHVALSVTNASATDTKADRKIATPCVAVAAANAASSSKTKKKKSGVLCTSRKNSPDDDGEVYYKKKVGDNDASFQRKSGTKGFLESLSRQKRTGGGEDLGDLQDTSIGASNSADGRKDNPESTVGSEGSRTASRTEVSQRQRHMVELSIRLDIVEGVEVFSEASRPVISATPQNH